MSPPPVYKINICPGVYYVNIPEADVRILCSSPADIVKHLIHKSLIREESVEGFYAENGPNSILLSDLSVQNGYFSNLTEFPVLQMLYKQGMLIPNHPNNTGEKPLIIGAKEQVKSQLEYLYRGNYGLTNKEEMKQAGLSNEEAEELLKIKLKFAFGKFQEASELISSLYLHENREHIKNGVYIKRVDINMFKIDYEYKIDGKAQIYTIDIDLNLYEGDKYPSPYVLGQCHIKRDYFSIVNSGEGDGWNTVQPCMSGVIVFQGRIYLIDAGPNIGNILQSLGIGLNEIEGLFHTHAHDDHFCGIISLMELDHRIKYYTTPLVHLSVMKKLVSILDIEDETILDKFFDFIPLKDGEWSNIDGLEVRPIFSPHPIETTIFQFRSLSKDGYKSYYHMADIASFDVMDNMLIKNDGDIGITKKRLDKVKKDYLIPASIKKIDVGEGMIHGSYKDFLEDESDQIILAHTSTSLNMKQKMIGSEVHFGSANVMIDNNCDLIFQRALSILKTYFIQIDDNLLITLLNNPITLFNPKTIIYRKNSKVKYVYMIITGNVSTISENCITPGNIGVGSFIGEMELLNTDKTIFTYRSESYASLLCIPKDIFINFVKSSKIEHNYIKLKRRRLFLQSSALFIDFLSGKVKNEVAKSLEIIDYKKGDTIKNIRSLLIVYSGEVALNIFDDEIYKVTQGDFFGEEKNIHNIKTIFTAIATSDVKIYSIPFFAIRNIPMIIKRSLEKSIKMHKLLMSHIKGKYDNYMYFEDKYELNIQIMDRQCYKLINLLNICFYIIEHKNMTLSFFETSIWNFESIYLHYSKYQEEEIKRYDFNNVEKYNLLHFKCLSNIKDIYHSIENANTKNNNQELILTQLVILRNSVLDKILSLKNLKNYIKEYSISVP